MNCILLEPTDVLFFRDGRPMAGSLAGHGAAWPLPNVVNGAFHAALHRAGLNGVHEHRRGARGCYESDAPRDRKFGALLTAGPFPVNPSGEWFFPRPADLQDGTLSPALLPRKQADSAPSSLPPVLRYAVASRLPPTKDPATKAWISKRAYRWYVKGENPLLKEMEAANDSEFGDTESSIGIAIDPQTGTTGQGETAGMIYSAHFLRLRDGWQLGVLASAWDKPAGSAGSRRDLIDLLLTASRKIVVGGQQRVCTASRIQLEAIPIPAGLRSGFASHEGKFLVKWILLTPAVWPEILPQSRDGRPMNPHPGGWLPNWIHPETGAVMLRRRTGPVKRDYSGAKARRTAAADEPIEARLVAAIVPKPITVTGWSLGVAPGEPAGAHSTHLAVPAGAIYYFETDTAAQATALADALNWHGSTDGSEIKNRRSTLMGEKGFGLGVCGSWTRWETSADAR